MQTRWFSSNLINFIFGYFDQVSATWDKKKKIQNKINGCSFFGGQKDIPVGLRGLWGASHRKSHAIVKTELPYRHLPTGLLGMLLPLEIFEDIKVLTGSIKRENKRLRALLDSLGDVASKIPAADSPYPLFRELFLVFLSWFLELESMSFI